MLTRPLTLIDSDDRGRGLTAVTPPPALPLADDDDETQTGVFSPPVPPWSSSSSSPASPPPPPPPPPLCASSSFSAPSQTPASFFSSSSYTPPPFPSPAPPTFAPLSSMPFSAPSPMSLLSPPPPPPSSVSPNTLPPLVFLTPCISPSSSPPVSSRPPPRSSVSSSPFISPSPLVSSPSLAPSLLPPPCSHSPPLPLLSSSYTPVPFSVSPPPSSQFSPLSSSCPPSLHPPPPPLLSPHSVCPPPRASPSVSSCPHDSPPFSSPPLPSLLYHSSSLVSLLPPSVFFTPCTPHTSAICSPLSSSCPPSLLSPPPPSSSPHVSLPSPPPPSPVAPSLLCSAPPHPPSCPCSSLLPRLLSAHRLEMRRLLRGALASLGRRLDSLERRSRRKRRKKRSRQNGEGGGSLGAAAFPCSPAHISPVSTCSSSTSSSEREDSPAPRLSCSLSQSQQSWRSGGEGRGRKRGRNNHRGREKRLFLENREEDEEEEDAGRFVGRMAVSYRGGGGAEEEAPLTLHNFSDRKHRRSDGGEASQSQKAVSVVRQNGYRAPLLLHSTSGCSSQHALQLLQSVQSGRTCSQSEALSVSSGQWCFSDVTPALSSNHCALRLWLCSSSSFSSAPMLRLSAVAVETMSVRGGACGRPLPPLKDWTAPPSLSSDHCYVRTSTSSPAFPAQRQQKQRANHSSRSLVLPRRRPLPIPPCSANGLSAPFPAGQSAAGSEFLSTNGERGKRVSQIRIRRASPRETPLTPMGLPKVKRLKKKEFSLEEIYTNKNYKSPTTNRSLETIFEEPREKDGTLLLIGQQRRRRLLLFPDFTQPRKRKRPQGAGLPAAIVPRKRAVARRHCHGNIPGDDDSDLDVMLVERLSALEDFLTRQGLDV